MILHHDDEGGRQGIEVDGWSEATTGLLALASLIELCERRSRECVEYRARLRGLLQGALSRFEVLDQDETQDADPEDRGPVVGAEELRAALQRARTRPAPTMAEDLECLNDHVLEPVPPGRSGWIDLPSDLTGIRSQVRRSLSSCADWLEGSADGGLIPEDWIPPASATEAAVCDLVLRLENLESALELAERALDAHGGGVLDTAELELLVEAQRSVRCWSGDGEACWEPAQQALYEWLRVRGEMSRIVSGGGRASAIAAPRADDLRRRLGERREAVAHVARIKELEQRVVRGLEEDLDCLGQDTSRTDRVASALALVNEWLDGGGVLTHPAIGDLLLSLMPHVPSSWTLTGAVQSMLDAAKGRSRQAGSARAEGPRSGPSPEVEELSGLLAPGWRLLLIGGNRCPEARARLQDGLGAEVHWIGTVAHKSSDHLVRAVAAEPKTIVVLLTRWADHAFLRLRQTTRDAGNLFVTAPNGYGTNRLALDVLEQVGEELRHRQEQALVSQ